MTAHESISSESLAALIVDALIDAGLIGKSATELATTIAAEEIEVRKAGGDYWCGQCPKSNPVINAEPCTQ